VQNEKLKVNVLIRDCFQNFRMMALRAFNIGVTEGRIGRVGRDGHCLGLCLDLHFFCNKKSCVTLGHFVHHKSHMTRPEPPLWEASD
jgi:hypothetical protein